MPEVNLAEIELLCKQLQEKTKDYVCTKIEFNLHVSSPMRYDFCIYTPALNHQVFKDYDKYIAYFKSLLTKYYDEARITSLKNDLDEAKQRKIDAITEITNIENKLSDEGEPNES